MNNLMEAGYISTVVAFFLFSDGEEICHVMPSTRIIQSCYVWVVNIDDIVSGMPPSRFRIMF
jgi:hypothetical protein